MNRTQAFLKDFRERMGLFGTPEGRQRNLQNNQVSDKKPVWVFDDFDHRFGCYKDILSICSNSSNFKVYKVGKTASGKPAHQALVVGRMSITKS